ncbi:MFS transporter [Nocardioides sp. SOB44]|uniref:MFS transporter n=1 Tax=Nocardioides cremeus TaxID=3058044 RepID=A0ABT8TS21_9ACTN|nr:MFS transporter [Nocardioides cremeus]MDO3396757.1 MFS transporter [Nocardioides cremeus]
MAGERFGRFWAAATISSFGTAVTAVAMPVLVVRDLEASAFAVGVVNAAQFLPYAVLGLVAGAYADRWRRQRVLVWSSLGRAFALGAIPVLWACGTLGVWTLVALLLAFGAFSVFGFAATQSLLPRLVPRSRLVAANARLDQGDAAAQTFGPALGGGLVGLLGAPVAIAIDAVSYVVDALLNARLGIDDSPPERTAERHLRREVVEGLRWTYRHPTLGPLAVSTHVWFLANGAAFTALAIVALREMGLSAVVFGLLVATGGVSRLLGATLAPAMGGRLGTGPTILATRAVHPAAWVLVALAPQVPAGVALLGAALALQGLAMGVENANDTGYWQLVTPDRLLGRANATRRSVNRTAAALGAILGGAALTLFDQGPTLLGIAVVFAMSAAIVGLSPVRRVRSA